MLIVVHQSRQPLVIHTPLECTLALRKVVRKAAQCREIRRTVLFAYVRLIFAESDIQTPMNTVLNALMVQNTLRHLTHSATQAGNVIAVHVETGDFRQLIGRIV